MPDSALYDHLNTTDTVEVITRKADGDERVTPIWSVVSGGAPYLRSVEGAAGLWYRRAVARGWVAFEVGGARREADVEHIDDAATIAAVDEALRAKYPAGSSVDAMVTEAARAATLRLLPRD